MLSLLLIILSFNTVFSIGSNITVYENYDIINILSGPLLVRNVCECKGVCLINTKEGNCTLFSVSGTPNGTYLCYIGVSATPEYQMVPDTEKTTFLIHKRFFLTEEKYDTLDIENDYQNICAEYHAEPGYIFGTEEYDTMRRDVLPYQGFSYFHIPLLKDSNGNRIWVKTEQKVLSSSPQHIFYNHLSRLDDPDGDCHYLRGPYQGHYYFLRESCSMLMGTVH